MAILDSPQVLIVTPARNEANNIKHLAMSLASQDSCPISAWIVVDDGSTDGTAQIVEGLNLPFDVLIVQRVLCGKLITGAAFAAWWQGVEEGLYKYPSVSHVMKLDADVELSEDYFDTIFKELKSSDVAVIGGIIEGLGREQKSYVPGPVKMYSRSALNLIRELPISTGFDVMDELLCRERGFSIQVVQGAKFRMNRQIGHSQGLIHGRYRNGLVCRWIGYAPEYFFLHVVRYIFRRPFVIGAMAMLAGYALAGHGPYAASLKKSHSQLQRLRLKSLLKHPVKTLRELYF